MCKKGISKLLPSGTKYSMLSIKCSQFSNGSQALQTSIHRVERVKIPRRNTQRPPKHIGNTSPLPKQCQHHRTPVKPPVRNNFFSCTWLISHPYQCLLFPHLIAWSSGTWDPCCSQCDPSFICNKNHGLCEGPNVNRGCTACDTMRHILLSGRWAPLLVREQCHVELHQNSAGWLRGIVGFVEPSPLWRYCTSVAGGSQVLHSKELVQRFEKSTEKKWQRQVVNGFGVHLQ